MKLNAMPATSCCMRSGGPGQNKLKAAKVLVVGAGGLGAPLIYYLAAAGVGTIGIIDHDTVSLSNLQRQIIHTTARVGIAKTASARETLAGAQSACAGRRAHLPDHRCQRAGDHRAI